MKKNNLLLLILLLSFIRALNAYGQVEPTFSKETETLIKKVEENLGSWVQIQDTKPWTLEERMKHYGVNGVTIAVIKNYKIEWAKGYGYADKAEQRIVDKNTLFQAASISKSLNAVGVLKLAQDKKIDLNTDINTYLKSWKFPYDSISKGKKITIANLLSHTGGTTIHGFPGYSNTDKLPTLINILDGKKPSNTEAVRSESEPGLKFDYSGGGTTISQLIVSDITGQPYSNYMGENVLEPFDMKNSSYEQPPSTTKKELLATGYTTDGKKIKTKYHVYPEQAAAGLWTNPTDLSKYIIEMQLSYKGKSNKVLSQEMVHTMLTPALPESTVALGVFIEKKGYENYFQHSGGNEGFRCQYFGSLESGNGVVVMINSDNGAILNEIINSVAKTYNWPDYYKPVTKTLVTVPENILNKYIGNYESEEFSFTIIKAYGSLWMKLPSATQKMYFTSDSDFFRYENKNSPKFILFNDGKVKGIQFNETFFVPKIK